MPFLNDDEWSSRWCDHCGVKPATHFREDGVALCLSCRLDALEVPVLHVNAPRAAWWAKFRKDPA